MPHQGVRTVDALAINWQPGRLTGREQPQRIERPIRHLGTLRDLGIHLAIDDFGTGYSSLAYLKQLPIDVLGIDRSFVSDRGSRMDDRSLVNAITMLGETLDLRIVAEGVETNVQLHVLNQLRCPFAQGYLWSRPEPAAEMTAWLRRSTGDCQISDVTGLSGHANRCGSTRRRRWSGGAILRSQTRTLHTGNVRDACDTAAHAR